MRFLVVLAAGCAPRIELGEITVDGRPDGASTSVVVRNRGGAPAWIWTEPYRLAPPDGGLSVLAYEVEPLPTDVIVEFFNPPGSGPVAPHGERVLDWDFAQSPLRDPCGDDDCAEALEVEVAWSARPLTRLDPEDGPDPWTAAHRLEDGVVTGTWWR